MKKDNHPKPPADADIERALAETLRLNSLAFPQNADDIAALESEVDPKSVPTPDVERFRRLLASGASPMEGAALGRNTIPFQLPEIAENLAMAARNGTTISPEVRAKMDADRVEHDSERNQRT